ncbi:exported hypothetical protein [Methylocella tundrae]|uniref:Rhodanese domain-containing protein n=1 Tax=Methylocella tundrae TaxID=227605 RepID=A0A8B6M1N8_METTU|nr:rhodanese-like domain-containing protein [Methylocella tundrae]VTZ28047.1 exported hypothetical protein [Methylocella tundrae]VTZ48927.1 exported hypothetical protein [Methylocella tundrae]
MRRSRVLVLASMLGLSGVGSAATQDLTGAAQQSAPSGIAGGRVIHTDELAQLLSSVILIDVSATTDRDASAASVKAPASHLSIPGSIWMPDAGATNIKDTQSHAFLRRLETLSNDDPGQPMVFYGEAKDPASRNAAERAVSLGYRSVFWYPDGIEGWRGAGHALAAPKAEMDAGSAS